MKEVIDETMPSETQSTDPIEEQAAPAILDKPFDLGSDDEPSQEEIDALYDQTMQDFREGEVVRGTVVELGLSRIAGAAAR